MISNIVKTFLIISMLTMALNANAFTFPWSKPTELKLTIPLKCKYGLDCFVLYYPDRIADDGFRDYECGKLSFENNQSVVFDVKPGIDDGAEVLAAAAGVVSEVVLSKPNKGIESLIDTGIPFVVISHPGGFKTKYSFLNQNRIMVKKGQRVKSGEPIAYTGKKNSSYDELYFTVSKRGIAFDPFLGPDASYGCNTVGNSLWHDPIPYEPVTETDYEFSSTDKFVKNISFTIKTWGLLTGDMESIQLYDPDSLMVSDTINLIDDEGMFYKSTSRYTENDDEKLEEGLWTAVYKVTRNNKVIFKSKESFVLNRDEKSTWKKI
jgi:murein DD-endopeptidase